MLSIRHRGRVTAGSLTALAATALFGLPGYACGGQPLPQLVSMPAYYSPSDAASWSELANAGSQLGFAVVNVANGPGPAADPAWQSVLDQASSASTTLIGYVDTGYFGFTGHLTESGAGDPAAWLAQIERDVDRWYAFYGDDMGGIFFDDAESACGPTAGSTAYVDLYRQLDDYVHTNYPDSMTVDNPGQSVSRCYANAADVLVTFEGDYASFLNPTGAQVPQAWQLNGNPDKFANLVFDVPRSDVGTAIAQSKKNNATYVFVTDRTLTSNPWLTPPSQGYLDEELSAAED